MLDNIIAVSFYAVVTLSGLMVFTGTIIQEEDSPLQKLLASFILVVTSTMIGTTFFDIEPKTLFLFHYMMFAIINLLFIKSEIKIMGLLAVESIVMLVSLLIPFRDIPLPNLSFLTIDSVLMALGFLMILVLFRLAKKSGFDEAVRTTITFIGAAILFTFIIPVEFSLPLNALLMALIAWYNITHVLRMNAIIHQDMADRLRKLEAEFNDELRRAVNKQTFHLKEVQERMSQINKIDNLTKAYNKKATFNLIDDLIMDRRTPEFSIIMFDIDHFKQLNDNLGHIKGDLCLRTLAKIAFECIRDTDYLGRFGGDEFMIILPKAKLQTALTIAERFRKQIEKDTTPKFTVSIGVAAYPEDGNSLKELLDIADKGLYYSKEKGRNSVSYHNPHLGKKY